MPGANLVRAGYAVRAGDRRPEAAEQAARCGAPWVPELARLAVGADVLVVENLIGIVAPDASPYLPAGSLTALVMGGTARLA